MAKEAYQAVKGPKDPGTVAAEWRRLTLQQLNSLPIQTRKEVIELKNNEMLFVGLLLDGSIDARTRDSVIRRQFRNSST